VPENVKKVAVFLRNPGDEDAVQKYAHANRLKVLYTFNTWNSAAGISSTIIRKGFRELAASLKRKRSFKNLLIKIVKRASVHMRHFNRSFMTMIEYVTEYKQCQGLLVYDVKDICPNDLAVVRWTIDKIRKASKEIYSVVPYAYEYLPQCKDNLVSRFDCKWSELIATCNFQQKKCPPIVSLCVFENKCFCRCRFCYQVKNPEAVREEYMDFELFQKIIHDIPPDEPLKIVLGAGGEPLTYPKIHEMVRYVTDTRPLATTEYSSNGILMDEENARKIIESGLKRIEISLNVPTREDYEWFTGIDAYDQVTSNMIGLMQLRAKLHSPTPIVVTKIMGIKRWADKIKNFINYWNGIIDEARVSAVSYYQDEELENIDSLKPTTNPLVPTCFYLTDNMVIMPNGQYQLCCAPDFAGEKYGPVDLGNARDENLLDVWNGEKYMELRRKNAQGLPIDANCLNCNINHPDFGSDLITKAKQRKILGFG